MGEPAGRRRYKTMATNGNGKANGKTNGKSNGKSNGLDKEWASNSRWVGVTRPYGVEDVERLRGSIRIEYTLARRGAERLWKLLRSEPYIPALGAMTGNQAIQQVKAGLLAIYVSGWQVAADANDAG